MLQIPQINPVRVRVANFPLSANHALGQQAGPRRLILDFHESGYVDVQLLVKSDRYELAADGSLGELAGSGYAKPDDVLLVANGDCAVDTDGIPRYRKITDTRPASAHHAEIPGTARNLTTDEVETFAPGQGWPGFLHAKPETLFFQNAAFGLDCAYNANQTIFDLLEHYIALADTAPSRFRPAPNA